MNRAKLALALALAALASATQAQIVGNCQGRAGAAGCPVGGQIAPLSQLKSQVRALGRTVAPAPTAALYAPRIADTEPYTGVTVQRDVPYGPSERNRLDVFVPESAGAEPRPVLVFVHGGAFVAGNRRIAPTSPFYDNVMLWAVRHGMIGVNMTYRLAPQDPWPSGPQDIGQAIRWVHEHIGSKGGDPKRVYLLGHSAGATHVAAYVAHERFHQVRGSGLAGALLLSGAYQITPELVANGPTYPAYFGKDASKYEEQSSLQGLVATRVPLWVGNAELDPPSFVEQAVLLRDALCKAGKCPAGVQFSGHSHMSEAYSIDSDDSAVGDAIFTFTQNHDL
jgi:acetyl esterase/lipase